MNSEIDELLGMVDEWKFKLHEKLKGLSPEEEAEFWKKAHKKGLAGRLDTARRRRPFKGAAKQRRRASA